MSNIIRGNIRRSQLIVPFGVGSIVNLPDESLMACSIDTWNDGLINAAKKVHDRRLEQNLNISRFLLPPSKEEAPAGIPFVRFPNWLFCPGRREIRPVNEWKNKWSITRSQPWDIPRCTCKGNTTKLVPSRFIIACENGHIDDFPWIEWVHNKNSICDNPIITFQTGSASAGLRGIKLKCKTCGARNTMEGTFNKEFFKESLSLKCSGNKPWAESKGNCNVYPRTIQRGSSNVYFPKIISSIHIPPFSNKIALRIQSMPEWDLFNRIDTKADMKNMLIKSISDHLDYDEEVIKKYMKTLLNIDSIKTDRIGYRYQEFKAFTEEQRSEELLSEDFETETITGMEYNLHGIEKIVRVERLRELRVLIAFSRIIPLAKNDIELANDNESEDLSVKAVSISESSAIDWLPCNEVRGEGIFLMLNDDLLKDWSLRQDVKKRLTVINNRLFQKCVDRNISIRQVNPQFVLLHTLSHLLIRRLSFECGYSSASLCERLYCNEDENHDTMNGILIYTASGDSSGTLGGLVRQSMPDVFPDVFRGALRDSAWCSSDPFCINSSGQGKDALNLGACHSCTLLPETSCEEFNSLLDRALVIGTPENKSIGFFSDMVYY